ncbi:hypothetical protein IW262DRAFT_1465915 [Armillaria fumosa]|nr:hypothetical protein IW262DRAFT_1465915 [Armillaria fumosa]
MPRSSPLSSSTSPTSAPPLRHNAPPISWYQHPTLSAQPPRQPRVTMRSAGHPDSFYVVMNGRIMGVFDSWNLMEGSFYGFPHQSYWKFPTLDDAIAAWNDAWTNQEIGYPADRRSNQCRFGPEWVRLQQHLTPKFYWLVMKGHSPGIYTVFDEALDAAGVTWYEVVITWDPSMASHLFKDLEQSQEVTVINAT